MRRLMVLFLTALALPLPPKAIVATSQKGAQYPLPTPRKKKKKREHTSHKAHYPRKIQSVMRRTATKATKPQPNCAS